MPSAHLASTAQQLALDLSLPPTIHPWRCDWCGKGIATTTINVLVWCYGDKRHICDACYDHLLQTAGVRVCRDCAARPNCRYLQENPDASQPKPSPTRKNKRTHLRLHKTAGAVQVSGAGRRPRDPCGVQLVEIGSKPTTESQKQGDD